jgi:hypothetical protein
MFSSKEGTLPIFFKTALLIEAILGLQEIIEST